MQTMMRRKWIMAGLALLLAVTLACGTSVVPGLSSVQPAGQATQSVQGSPALSLGATAGPVTPLPQEVVNQFGTEEAVLVDIYHRVDPAVVNITVSAKGSNGQIADFAGGSGFVIDNQGHIVTNNHVVDQADLERVTFSDGTVLPATVVGKDPFSDLAVIKVDVPADYHLTVVELGDSDSVQPGQMVVAIGNPFGLTGSMTTGIVSAVGRTLPSSGTADQGAFQNPLIIQTDAAINPGNSGGPLLDSHGRVIGVNAAIRSDSGTSSGIGFAIPVNTVKRIVTQLIQNGTVHYAYLGIKSQSVPSLAELALEYDVPVKKGVLVAEVAPGGPADKAGLRGGTKQANFRGHDIVLGGDIITAVNGVPVADFDELIGYLLINTEPGQTVKLSVIRDNQTMEIDLTLGERPASP